MSKKDENGMKQCTKCECLYFAEKSGQQSHARNKKTQESHQPFVDDDESSDGIVISPTCHETVKIFVRSPCGKEFYNDKHNGNALVSAEIAPKKVDKETEEAPQKTQNDPVENSKPESSQDPHQKKGSSQDPDRKKGLCFSFGRKKKKPQQASKNSIEVPKTKTSQDCNTQTCQAILNSTKTQSSDTNIGEGPKNNAAVERSEMDIAEIIKNCRTCPSCARQGSGGCNTNTIIFPRDNKSGGDGLTCLENWLRFEAKVNSRNFEDVLNEIHKVKRDIHELKDMIDAVSRAVREQLFMSAYGKGKSELLVDLNRQKNLERKMNNKVENTNNVDQQKHLERKTNTLSLTDAAVDATPGKAPNVKKTPGGPVMYVKVPKTANSAPAYASPLSKPPASDEVVKVTHYTQVGAHPLVEEEIKKKRFFPWCK